GREGLRIDRKLLRIRDESRYGGPRMTVEPTIPSSSPGAGALLRLIRDGQASTRAELVALTGLARSTVAQRMDALLSQRLVVPAGGSVSTGGRPPPIVPVHRHAGGGS